MINHRRRLIVLAGASAWLLARAAVVQANEPLKLGIMPFNSTLALIKTHAPIRDYLQAKLGRPVEIYTSADYFTFINESLAGRFDLLITGPHFGVMSIDKGYQPLFRYRAVLEPLFVVRPQSGIKSVADLRGKKIGLSSRLSMSSIGGVRWLQDHGLQVGRDYQLSERTTHGAAVAAVAVGELDAALTTHTPLKQIPEDVRAKVSVLQTEIKVPHLMTLIHPRLGKREVEAVRAALKAFSESAPEGRAFFEQTGYLGYEEISAADLRTLKPYVELTRKMMAHNE
jgi:phosphonate transport system substrate-binding protein